MYKGVYYNVVEKLLPHYNIQFYFVDLISDQLFLWAALQALLVILLPTTKDNTSSTKDQN